MFFILMHMKSKSNINDSALFQILTLRERIKDEKKYISNNNLHIFVRKYRYIAVYYLIDFTVMDKHIQGL